jgi:hypothetical protein
VNANQRLVVSALELNVTTAGTEGLRKHAEEQLQGYLARAAARRQSVRASPFSRFVDHLERRRPETPP